MRKLLFPAAVLVVSMLACGRGEEGARPKAFRPVMAGDTAPSYAAVTLAGDSVHLGAGTDSVTLLNVWATWCQSCREEFEDLERLHGDFSGRGLRVIAVSVDAGGPEVVRRFVRSEEASFPIVHDGDGRIERAYSTVGVPSTYLIGRDGKVAWALTGNLHPVVSTVRAEVEKALY